MGNVLAEFSMSLDGYIAGPGIGVDTPMGWGGEALHDWMFREDGGAYNAAARERMIAGTGATIVGRRTYDLGIAHWQDVPFPVPCLVLTHHPLPARDAASGRFEFVSTGLHSALRTAHAAAGGRDVRLMGADVTRQALCAGLVDEIVVQLVPILLGGGVRPFPEGMQAQLREIDSVSAPHATHLRYTVVRE